MTTEPQNAPPGCNYWHRGSTMECRGDGYLWDADDDGYDPDDTDSPCPQCNTLAYLQRAKEEAESVSEGSTHATYYTGVSLWEGAVAVACRANPEQAALALKIIGQVKALRPHPTDKAEFLEVEFIY